MQCTTPTTVHGSPCIIRCPFSKAWPWKNITVKVRRVTYSSYCFKTPRMLGSGNTNTTLCFPDCRISTQKEKQHLQTGVQLVGMMKKQIWSWPKVGHAGGTRQECGCLFSGHWMCPNPNRRLVPSSLPNKHEIDRSQNWTNAMNLVQTVSILNMKVRIMIWHCDLGTILEIILLSYTKALVPWHHLGSLLVGWLVLVQTANLSVPCTLHCQQ